MNILFIMNNYPDPRNGGIETVTLILSEQFIKFGHSVHIRYIYNSEYKYSNNYIFSSCKQITKKEIANEITITLQLYNIDIIINQNIIFASNIIKRTILNSKCTLVTSYHNKPTLEPPTIKNIFLSKDISIIKKIIILISYPLFVIRSKRNLMNRHKESYKASDYTVLLSKYYIPEYSQMMNIGIDKLVYLNNPLRDNLTIDPLEIKNKEKTILMVTRLDERQKCIIKALKTWEKIVVSCPDWKLKIIGSGPDENRIKGYAKKNNIKNVEFYQAQDPEKFYREASIFIMTSRNEGWPNTLNEAMRLGCVPVAIDTFSAIDDIITDKENGIIIRPTTQSNDIENCAKAITMLINDKELLRRMAENANKRTENLSAEVIAKQWIELFEECIKA